MKKLFLCSLFIFSTVAINCEELQFSNRLEEIQYIATTFKQDLNNYESFAELFSSFSKKVESDFDALLTEIITMIFDIEDYRNNVKNTALANDLNALLQKYKNFKNIEKLSIIWNIGIGPKDSECKSAQLIDFSKNDMTKAVQEALQPFYDTLSEEEQVKCKQGMEDFCKFFFFELRPKFKAIFKRHQLVVNALRSWLTNTQQSFDIELGFDFPLPSLCYILE